MDNIIAWFILLLMVGVLVAISYFQAEAIKTKIRREVKAQGGDEITIIRKWGDGDRDTYTFEVSFLDAQKRYYTTNCKVQTFSHQLYWTKSPKELIQSRQDVGKR